MRIALVSRNRVCLREAFYPRHDPYSMFRESVTNDITDDLNFDALPGEKFFCAGCEVNNYIRGVIGALSPLPIRFQIEPVQTV